MKNGTSYELEVKTGSYIKFHSGGQILVHQSGDPEGTAVQLPKGELIKHLHGVVQFYHELRVRDLFKLLINYPEITPLFPSFIDAVKSYEKYPTIGCSNQNVMYIGIKREREINTSKEVDHPYTDSFMHLIIRTIKGDDQSADPWIGLFNNQDPKAWLDMKLSPVKSDISFIDSTGQQCLWKVDDFYTVYDILDAFNYALENEVDLLPIE